MIISNAQNTPDFNSRIGFNRRLRGFGLLESPEAEQEIRWRILNSVNAAISKWPHPNVDEAFAVYHESISATRDLDGFRDIPEFAPLVREADAVTLALRYAFMRVRDNRSPDGGWLYNFPIYKSPGRWDELKAGLQDMINHGHHCKNLIWDNIPRLRDAYNARIQREAQAAHDAEVARIEAERAAAIQREEEALRAAATAAAVTTSTEVQILQAQQEAVNVQRGLTSDVRTFNQASIGGVPLVPALGLGALLFGGHFLYTKFAKK